MSEKRKELLRTLKFVAFSISAGVIQLGADVLFNEVLQWRPSVSYLLSLILSVLWNFTLNRKFTFHSAGNVPVAMLKVALFYAVFAPCLPGGRKCLLPNITGILIWFRAAPWSLTL